MGETPEFASVRRAYDTVAEDYAAFFHDARTETADNLAVIDRFADAVAEGPVPGVILDAGCGTGRMSRYLAARGTTVQGIDLSPGMIAQARRAQPGVTFDVGSLTDLPYDDGVFAGVLLWYSIIHTPAHTQPDIFAEVRRVLHDGGHVLVGFQTGQGVHDVAQPGGRRQRPSQDRPAHDARRTPPPARLRVRVPWPDRRHGEHWPAEAYRGAVVM